MMTWSTHSSPRPMPLPHCHTSLVTSQQWSLKHQACRASKATAAMEDMSSGSWLLPQLTHGCPWHSLAWRFSSWTLACLPACLSTGPSPGLPHLCLHPPATQQCPANSHPFQDQRENKETSPQFGLTRNGQHGRGLFRPLIDPAAVLNPEDADGFRWAHGLAGEVEGGVFGDVQALGLHSEVRKSCRERVKGRRFQNQMSEGME